MIKEITHNLNKIVGTKCWNVSNVIVGALRLNFGDALKIRLLHSDFSHVGQYDMLIWCQWRLDSGDNTLCGWECSHEEINRIASCLAGDIVTSIDVYPPVWDAHITFSSGKKLKIFCNYVHEQTLSSNWSFGIMDVEYYVGINNDITKGQRLGIFSNSLVEYTAIPADAHVLPLEGDIDVDETHQEFTNTLKILDEMREQLKVLIGRQCLSVINKSDASLRLDFGSVIKRICSEKEKMDTGNEFQYEGEYDILVWCVWRLENVDNGICSSASTNEQCETLTKQLIGQTISSIEIIPPAWDAVIAFSSGLILKIFCIYTQDSDIETNWFFRNVEILYCVNRADNIEKAKIDWNILYENKSVSP